MAHPSAPPSPSRSEVQRQIERLLKDAGARADVASWAMQWVDARDPSVDDETVWKTLNNLAGADSPSIDRPYLYGQVDFEAWLNDVRAQ